MTKINKDSTLSEIIRYQGAKEILVKYNLPCLGKPEDIVQVAVYLAFDESDFVNGEVLVINGEWIAK